MLCMTFLLLRFCYQVPFLLPVHATVMTHHGDGLSYSTPQKSKETRGNAITQPRSHPMKGSHASTMAQFMVVHGIAWYPHRCCSFAYTAHDLSDSRARSVRLQSLIPRLFSPGNFRETPCCTEVVVCMHGNGVLNLSSNGRPTFNPGYEYSAS